LVGGARVGLRWGLGCAVAMGNRLASTVVLSLCLFALTSGEAAAAQFRSPSGNIGCYIDASGVRCDINERDWSAPHKPASCDLDFGQGVQVGRSGRARYVCAGDTTLGAGPRLAYSSSIRRGRFRCLSLRSHMRCDNLRNGHGFALSRQRVRLF
jgi:hypothetical protein